MDTEKKCCCRNIASVVSGILFALIAVLHLVRIFLDWEVMLNGNPVPTWPSWLGVVIGIGMAAWNFCGLCCKRCNPNCGHLPAPPVQ